jgi:hypothetical protein
VFQALMTIDLLKQSAIPWSYVYKHPDSDVTYDVTNTCPIDTALQMVYFLWFRGFVPHFIVEKDSLLLQTLIHIRNQNYDQARHEFQMKNIRPKKTPMDGNKDKWDSVGDPWDYRQFPVLFLSNGPIYMTWENCSKKGEDCPLHDCYIKLSTCHRNFKALRFQFITNPIQKGTIHEIIDQKYGTCEIPCRGDITLSPYNLDSEAKDEPKVVKVNLKYCPYDGMRKHHCVASFNSCPWVMVVRGYFQHYNFHSLNDIPNSVLFPPDTQYSLASVILTDGGHYIGISLDITNSPIGFTSYLMESKYKHEERIQVISLEDPLSKIAPGCNVMELWHVKVDSGSSSAGTEISSLIIPPMAPAKDMGIHRFAKQKQLPECDTGQSALPTEDKSVNWKQSSSNTHSSEQKQSSLLKSLTTKEMYLKAIQEMYPEANM